MTKNKNQFLLPSIAATILVLSVVLYVSRQMGNFKLDKQITQVKKVTFLVHGLSNGNDYLFSVLVSMFPKDKKIGLYFVNPLSVMGSESEPLLKLKSGAPKTVERELERILGFSVNYSFTIKESQFKKLVNLIGGLPVYFEPKTNIQSSLYDRPTSDYYTLDGDDAYEYLTYLPSQKAPDYVYRLERQESAFLTLYEELRKKKDQIRKGWINIAYSWLDTNMDESEFGNLLEFLLTEPLYFGVSELPGELQGVPKSDSFVLKIHSDVGKIAYKKFEADLLSEFFADTERARTEVLNGTPINGLAKKAKSLMNERRIKVLSVENAWSDSMKTSLVLDRSGNTKLSHKVSESLNDMPVFYVIRKELGLDVTVLLGEEFEKSK